MGGRGTSNSAQELVRTWAKATASFSFSMTEPQGGSDPREFKCQARRDGDDWVISGEKYYSSHADFADFLIAMVITDPDVPVHKGASMMLVPGDAPGDPGPVLDIPDVDQNGLG